MKILSTLVLVAFIVGSIFAQKDVYLQINHKLGSAPFAFNQTATTSLGHNFNVQRLEYYVSQIKLTYDGGQDTIIQNKWILANANTQVHELLGSLNITTLEKVGFGIGVEAAVNHNDPSLWPAGHPLTIGSPSMHWGWTSGYRFVAIEGMCGATLNDNYDIHALDDINYFTQVITTAGTEVAGDLIISLDADYTQAFNGIDMSTGVISHGSINEAPILLSNFKNSVFTPGSYVSPSPTGLNTIELETIKLYPNPVSHNKTVSFGDVNVDRVEIKDLTGRVVQKSAVLNNSLELEVANGTYITVLFNKNVHVATGKLVVTK